MTIEEIRELIQIVNESGVAELEVTRGDSRVRIRRSNAGTSREFIAPASQSVAAASAGIPSGVPASSTSAPAIPATPPAAPAADETTTVYVKSPIVGTYYESPSPGSPPFVKVGDRVSPGQVLCIIESMKLMNEIESEVSGIVISRLIENGRPVEYGESLFAVQPV